MPLEGVLLALGAGVVIACVLVWLILALGNYANRVYLPRQLPKVVKRDDGLWLEWWEYSANEKTAIKREKPLEGIGLPWWWKR